MAVPKGGDSTAGGDWVKVHRSIMESLIWSDPMLLKVALWCVMKANWKTGYFLGQVVSRGQLAVSGESAAESLDISRFAWMRAIKKLQSINFISIKSHSRFTIITVCKYETYQKDERAPRTTAALEPHLKRTTAALEPHTIEEGKKGRREEGISSQPACADFEPSPTRAAKSGMNGHGKPQEEEAEYDPAACKFPDFPTSLRSGKPATWSADAEFLESISAAFPLVDVDGELLKAHAWIKTNLTKRKTYTGYPEFFRKWCSRQQDRGTRPERKYGPPGSINRNPIFDPLVECNTDGQT